MPPPLAHAWLTAGRRAPAGGPQLTGARARLGRQVLRELSGGAAPAKVIATGHSLGGGLASLCGVWAALQWPGADVRVVTLGSPKVGNQAWVDVRARPGRPARPAPARARKPAVAAALPCRRARPLWHGVHVLALAALACIRLCREAAAGHQGAHGVSRHCSVGQLRDACRQGS